MNAFVILILGDRVSARTHYYWSTIGSLRSPLEDRRGWHGRSLSGRRHAATSQRRVENSPAGPRSERRSDAALRTGGYCGSSTQSSECCPHLRDRRKRWRDIHSDGVHRWSYVTREDSSGRD